MSTPDSRYKKFAKDDEALKKMEPEDEEEGAEKLQKRIALERKALKDDYLLDCLKVFVKGGSKLNWVDFEGLIFFSLKNQTK